MVKHILKRLLLGSSLLLFTYSAFSSTLLPTQNGGCDSIFLSNGKVYAVKKLSWNDTEISFAFCDDPANKMHSAPWMQIHRIKKSDGSVIDSSVRRPNEPILTREERSLENKVADLNLMAILAIPALLLFGVGLILAIIVLFRSAKLKKAVIGHPNEHWLLKKIKRSRRIAQVMLFSWLLLGLIGFGYLIYFFTLFGKNQ